MCTFFLLFHDCVIEILLRFVIPIRKIVLDEETLSKPIPTLSDRQFVVAHSDLSHQEQRAQRELFWYREELFKCVKGRWHEVSFFPLSIKSLLTI